MWDRPVTRLRHIAVAIPEYDEALDFYSGPWGLKKVDQGDGVAYFAAEGSPEQYVLRVRKAAEKRLDLIALRADDAAAVDNLASNLAESGVRFASEPGKLQTPGGGYGFRFFDPDGRTLEVSADVAERPYRMIEERESIPSKLSHIVLNSANQAEAVKFYQEQLGFRLSDTIIGGLTFMRCTVDHHGIAIGSSKETKLNHFAFEMRGIEEQHRATGRLMELDTPYWRVVARNIYGDNVCSYFYGPGGNVSEFTAEMNQIPLNYERTPTVMTPEQNRERNPWKKVAQYMDSDRIPTRALAPETGHWVAPPV